MPPATPHLTVEDLLLHESFIRRTLRGLLADEGQVQDTLQETWLRVLQRPAAELASLREPRTWLARVARNLALSKGRSDTRRAVREESRGERDAEESPAESLARIETRQRVGAAIVALHEPYRSVVLLRYEQGLATDEIAARLERSEATVRSQLSRAHEILRTRLDQEFGDRRQWAGLVLPLAKPAWGLMTLAAGVAVVALGGGLIWSVATSEVPAGLTATPTIAAAAPQQEVAASAPELATPQLSANTQDGPQRKSAGDMTTRSTQDEASTPATPGPTDHELLLPVAELFDRGYYKDYERATFSLEHGLRDDPGLARTRNDWGFLFGQDQFRMRTVSDDRSIAVDLGAVRPANLRHVSLGNRALDEDVKVQKGHTYFMWILDSETDLAAYVYVRELEPQRTCELDWYVTDGTGRAQGSFADDGIGEPLVDQLVRLRREARQRDRRGILTAPRALLQARVLSNGGNPAKVPLQGTTPYIREESTEALDLFSPAAMEGPTSFYREGGWIPEGRVFQVHRVTYAGTATAETVRLSPFVVVLGGREIVKAEIGDLETRGVWTGSIDLAPGDESKTYLELRNYCAGEVLLQGILLKRESDSAFGAPNAGFFADIPSPTPTTVTDWLDVPRVVFQARSGAGGGNSNTVDLSGKVNFRFDSVSAEPLDFTELPTSGDDAVVYVEGGALRPGAVFVVTRVTWRGTCAGDSNGPGELKLVVAGKTLVEEKDEDHEIQGSWSGALRVSPDEESRTYLEIANTSSADVLLTGYFEQP